MTRACVSPWGSDHTGAPGLAGGGTHARPLAQAALATAHSRKAGDFPPGQRPRHSQAFGAETGQRWGFQHPPGKSPRPLPDHCPAESSPTQPRPSPLVDLGGNATWRRRKTLPMSPNSHSPSLEPTPRHSPHPWLSSRPRQPPAQRHSFLPHPLPPPWPHSASGPLRGCPGQSRRLGVWRADLGTFNQFFQRPCKVCHHLLRLSPPGGRDHSSWSLPCPAAQHSFVIYSSQ